jgi:hypothetical protein
MQRLGQTDHQEIVTMYSVHLRRSMIMQPARNITLTSLVLLMLLASGRLDSHVRAQETRGAAGLRAAADRLDRTVLPIQEPASPPSPSSTRGEVKAPQGAPNVVVVLINDMGFGQPGTFGGGIAMPTLDRLAAGGRRYNTFHTTALCSPT